MGQNQGAANHLIGMLGVDAQLHRKVDGLVELLRGRVSFTSFIASSSLYRLVAVDLLEGRLVLLRNVRHVSVSSRLADDSMPMDSAVPSTVRIAASRLPAVMSCIFIFAICSTCFPRHLPDLLLAGLVRAGALLLLRVEAGRLLEEDGRGRGLDSWKLNDRSWYTVMMTGMISASFA